MMTTALPPNLSAAAAARSLVRQWLAEWGLSGTVDDAEIVVSELVANAVSHGATPISLTASCDGGLLLLAVEDAAAGRVPQQRHAGPEATGGRGLLLIGALSKRWGYTVGAASKVVWAELAAR